MLKIVACSLLVSGVAFADGDMKPHGQLKGHGNLIKAEQELHASAKSISKSQEANECVFGVEGGHGQKAKEAIVFAEKQVWEAAEWVNTHAKDCEAFKPGKDIPKSNAIKLRAHPELKGHPNLIAAEKDLHSAYGAITKSQEANECVFGLEGGHGAKAKEAIEAAAHQIDEAAEWVSSHANACTGKPGKM